MDHLEMVEKLAQKAGVSYEDAKMALEACNWDMLDALVYLEKLGKTGYGAAWYSTDGPEPDGTVFEEVPPRDKDTTFGELCGKFFGFIGRLIEKGNQNYLDVTHKGKHVLSISMTVLVLLLILGFWVIIPLMIVGLFFQFQYHFRGTGSEEDINNILDKASNAAESVKREMKGKD